MNDWSRYQANDGRPVGEGRAVVVDTRSGEVIFRAPAALDIDTALRISEDLARALNHAPMDAHAELQALEDESGPQGPYATSPHYAAKGGNLCPHCGSGNLTTTNRLDVITHGALTIGIECNDCGASWDDAYSLYGYRNLEPPKDTP